LLLDMCEARQDETCCGRSAMDTTNPSETVTSARLRAALFNRTGGAALAPGGIREAPFGMTIQHKQVSNR